MRRWPPPAGATTTRRPTTPPARWRRRALDWLQDERAAYGRLMASGPPADRADVARRLGRWEVDPALAAL
jgi:hypothetical protein